MIFSVYPGCSARVQLRQLGVTIFSFVLQIRSPPTSQFHRSAKSGKQIKWKLLLFRWHIPVFRHWHARRGTQICETARKKILCRIACNFSKWQWLMMGPLCVYGFIPFALVLQPVCDCRVLWRGCTGASCLPCCHYCGDDLWGGPPLGVSCEKHHHDDCLDQKVEHKPKINVYLLTLLVSFSCWKGKSLGVRLKKKSCQRNKNKWRILTAPAYSKKIDGKFSNYANNNIFLTNW